ncbi:MAG TPA: DUF459 domain-containing protein [Gaiellaceae bacterium]|nr:DUF459 domain-containing protein [Gaiellaceae bacterium]
MEEPRTRRRRPARREEEGRRLHSAGAAIAVTLGALLLGALLNAPGLHKSATIQPEGWKRDLALAVTGPLADASEALLLDRPRRGLKAALGRAQDDAVDTEVEVPEPPRGGRKPPPPRRERFTPTRPLRFWIAGDSLVVVPGESLLRLAGETPALEPVGRVDGRIASGLERPDVFNWFRHVREQLRARKPHAVVLMFGGNDDHGFMTGLPDGVTVGPFGGESWRGEYARRVGGIMDSVARAGAFLVWIGLPVTRDAEQTRRFDVINAIVQAEAAKRPRRVAYLDTYFFFAGEDGGYAQYLDDPSGKLVKMRADDGVHFERPAGDLIARKVVELLRERFVLAGGAR